MSVERRLIEIETNIAAIRKHENGKEDPEGYTMVLSYPELSVLLYALGSFILSEGKDLKDESHKDISSVQDKVQDLFYGD